MAEKNVHCSDCGHARSSPVFQSTSETIGCVVVQRVVELAFPLHTRVLRDFFTRAAR